MLSDRVEAGRLLGERLSHLKGKGAVVLALPRGGVVVGREVARVLGAPLDILVSRKLGAPGDPELAIGAVAEGGGPHAVLNEGLLNSLGVSDEYLRAEVARQLQEIARRQAAYRGGRPPLEVAGRIAVLVDDGIATGASIRASIGALRGRRPLRIVLAVPVAPPDALAALGPEVDELHCLDVPEPFVSVGSHYEVFDQTSDEEVVRLLESAGGN